MCLGDSIRQGLDNNIKDAVLVIDDDGGKQMAHHLIRPQQPEPTVVRIRACASVRARMHARNYLPRIQPACQSQYVSGIEDDVEAVTALH